jgi:hypothetical protein
MTRGVPRVPDFYIVGAPKAGTTAMYEYLRGHPDLYLPERKELRFFGSDLDIRDRTPLTTEEFLAYFADAPAEASIGSAYVWYLYSRLAAAEIASLSPDARIIAMLRNPVTMLPALHAEHLTNGNEDIRDFTAALDAEPDRRAGRRIPPHAHLPQGLWYTDVPRYAEQLERYFAIFGPERVRVIVFDDFVADTAGTYRDTLRFLGVDDAYRPPSFDAVNTSRRLRSERWRHFLARPPDLPRRVIHYLVPARVRRAAYERAKAMNIVSEPRRPLPPETSARLDEAFGPEIARLSTLLDRNLEALWRRS